MSVPRALPRVRMAAHAATALFLLSAALQLSLAAGILPATMAWGGRQAVLTPGLRGVSIVAAVLLLAFADVMRRRAGLTGTRAFGRDTRVLAYLVAGFMVLNVLGNLASVSTGERLLFGPISLLLAVACTIVATSRPTS